MNVVFRVDASSAIGTGHLMRCLTLADELAAQGAEVRFLMRRLEGDLLDWLREQRPYAVESVEPTFDEAPDAATLRQPDWLVVDHYGLDRRFEAACRPLVGRILVIDDLANRPHECDVLLDQNFYEQPEARYKGLLPPACVSLLGPTYALLRPEFQEAAQGDAAPGEGAVVLLSFGGSDPANMTLRVLQAIDALPGIPPTTEAVLGSANPFKAHIEAFAQDKPWVVLSYNVTDMARRMARATCCIGAGGTTVLERMAVGLPSLVISIADNQLEICRTADRQGAHWYLGPAEAMNEARIQQALQALLSDAGLRRQFSEKGKALVDGRGASRVASEMRNPAREG